jgi:hypothetical protein
MGGAKRDSRGAPTENFSIKHHHPQAGLFVCRDGDKLLPIRRLHPNAANVAQRRWWTRKEVAGTRASALGKAA